MKVAKPTRAEVRRGCVAVVRQPPAVMDRGQTLAKAGRREGAARTCKFGRMAVFSHAVASDSVTVI